MRNVDLVKVPDVQQFKRDAGKLFKITEKDATAAEKWALRLFLVMKGTSGEVPAEMMQFGMLAVGWRGLNAFLAADVDPDKLMPLLDEMMECVQAVRDRSRADVAQPLIEADIEEPGTRMWLRGEVLRVHTGFSAADALSRFLELSKAASANLSSSQSAQTSPPQSPGSSTEPRS